MITELVVFSFVPLYFGMTTDSGILDIFRVVVGACLLKSSLTSYHKGQTSRQLTRS